LRLVVNGETVEHREEETLATLLQRLGANDDRVATMVNDEVVPKKDRLRTKLSEGDRVEVLVFAGGG